MKKYFMSLETARRFARKKQRPVMATSDVWRKKDKRRRRKLYVVKW